MTFAQVQPASSEVRTPMTPHRRILWALALICGAIVLWFAARWAWQRDTSMTMLDPAQIILIRTPGGMLEVGKLIRTEEFGWSSRYNCPIIDCPDLFKPTISRVRVRAHYVYRIPLAAQWKLEPRGTHYALAVPEMEPQRPVSFETSTMEIATERQGWFSPPSAPNREAVVRHMGPELDRRSAQPQYLQATREQAAQTVQEFARKWMREQGLGKDLPIRVTIGSKPAKAAFAPSP